MMNRSELDDLRRAKHLLSNPGLAIQLSGLLGNRIESGVACLPKSVQSKVTRVASRSIRLAADVALFTLDTEATDVRASRRLHQIAAMASGALGGAFGLPGLSIELPVSTAIIMRSIADIARSEQAVLTDPRTRVECLTVFALGGASKADDGADCAYYAARRTLAMSVTEAAQYLATTAATEAGGPVLTRFIARIAARYGIQVSQKVAAQLVPVIGAAGGAAINAIFMSHYQNMARGHFIVKRLEAVHGMECVKKEFDNLNTSVAGDQLGNPDWGFDAFPTGNA